MAYVRAEANHAAAVNASTSVSRHAMPLATPCRHLIMRLPPSTGERLRLVGLSPLRRIRSRVRAPPCGTLGAPPPSAKHRTFCPPERTTCTPGLLLGQTSPGDGASCAMRIAAGTRIVNDPWARQ
jgi:hypothetical protein